MNNDRLIKEGDGDDNDVFLSVLGPLCPLIAII